MLRLSIITPSYKQGKYLKENIISVQQQDYSATEHIIVDGGSRDGTLEILKSYSNSIRWISEKDEGQADALNKGLALSTGEILGWINSDDYYEHNVFNDVMRQFEDENIQWVVGNLSMAYEELNKIVPKKSPQVAYKRLLDNPDIVRQQPTFFRRSFLEKVGAWNKQFYMVMDFDLWVRMAKCAEPKMVDRNWAYFRIQPEQKTSEKNLLRQVREIETILVREGVPWISRQIIIFRKYYYLVKHSVKVGLISLGIIDKAYKHVSYSVRNQ